MSAEDVKDRDMFYHVLAEGRSGYLLEYTAKEMQHAEQESIRWREVEATAALALQKDTAGGDHPETELPRANSDCWCL